MIGQVYVCDWLINQKHVKPSHHGGSTWHVSFILRLLPLNSQSSTSWKQRKKDPGHERKLSMMHLQILRYFLNLMIFFVHFGDGDSRIQNHQHVGTGEFPSSSAFRCSGDIKEPRNRVIQLGPQTYIHGLGNASLHPLAPKGGFMAIVMGWKSLKVLDVKGGLFCWAKNRH